MNFSTRRNALSWGRIVRAPQRVASPRFRDEVDGAISSAPAGSVLAVGLRRSYSDSVLNSTGGLIDMTGIDRLISFDTERGVLRAEAGISLGEILRLTVPAGWFLPVSPGTRFVTLGGAIANDVHGKNHHRVGTFGCHVRSLGLVRSDGACEIGPRTNTDLFASTIGGLGLTGVIDWAEIQLQPIKSSFVDAEIIPYGSLPEFWQLAEGSLSSHEHTVAWIDCTAKGSNLGRGVFSRGNWSTDGRLKAHAGRQWLSVPFDAPSGLLNRLTVSSFNHAYYAAQRLMPRRSLQRYARFFHPLDSIGRWNRLYGRRGFWQYQCVVPQTSMREAIAALLEEIARSREGSFLAVLKTFGAVASPGLLSFPMEGATLSLDFPNRGQSTLDLFQRLDAIVAGAGGRLYAAKDGRVPKAMWRSGYPELDRFAGFVDRQFASDFWRRVAS